MYALDELRKHGFRFKTRSQVVHKVVVSTSFRFRNRSIGLLSSLIYPVPVAFSSQVPLCLVTHLFLNILYLYPPFLSPFRCHLPDQGVLSLPFEQELLISTDEHSALASGEHDIGTS